MSQAELDELLERMPAIAEAVQRFSSETIQAQVFEALVDAFRSSGAPGGRAGAAPKKRAAIKQVERERQDDDSGGANSRTAAKRSGARKTGTPKSKQAFSIDKQLDLRAGSTDLQAFAEEKSPRNGPEKAVISIYWLTRILGTGEPATLDRVYTCFKHMKWPVPTDLANTIQQAGAKGWLDSRKRDDLKVVVGGENHVEHEMPAAQKR